MVIIKSLIKELKSRKMQFNVEHLHVISKDRTIPKPTREKSTGLLMHFIFIKFFVVVNHYLVSLSS